MLLNQNKSIIASRTQILFPKQMFPSLATLGETMFPSLARPLRELCKGDPCEYHKDRYRGDLWTRKSVVHSLFATLMFGPRSRHLTLCLFIKVYKADTKGTDPSVRIILERFLIECRK